MAEKKNINGFLTPDEQQGLLYGSLISAGLNAAMGNSTREAITNFARGGSQAYAGGVNALFKQKQDMLENERIQQMTQSGMDMTELAKKRYGLDEREQDFREWAAMNPPKKEMSISDYLNIQKYGDTQKKEQQEGYGRDILSVLEGGQPPEVLKGKTSEGGTVQKYLESALSGIAPKMAGDYQKEQAGLRKEDLAEARFAETERANRARESATGERIAAAERRATETGGKSDDRFAMSLRKEYNGLQPIKDYRDIKSRYNVMEKAFKESKTTNNYVAVDQALITLYNKMTDPQSVVRESEYVRTPQDMAVMARAKAAVLRVAKGGRLESDSRQAIMTMATKFKEAYTDQAKGIKNEYRRYASDAGVDPKKVIGEEDEAAPAVPQKAGRFTIREKK